NHHHVVVDRHTAGADDDGIAHHLVGKLNIASDDVVELDRVLGNLQPYSSGFARAVPALGFGRIKLAALAGIDRLPAFSHRLLAFALQPPRGAKTVVSFVLAKQTLGIFAIDVHAVRLAIWRIRAADIGTFIPIEAEPLQIGEKLGFVARLAAFHVSVFDAQDE